jgi:hypothetical protein
MVFLYYALPYYLAPQDTPFHFIDGMLYPNNGGFRGSVQVGTPWYFQIGY